MSGQGRRRYRCSVCGSVVVLTQERHLRNSNLLCVADDCDGELVLISPVMTPTPQTNISETPTPQVRRKFF